jgi:hypothetical protein
VLWPRRGRQRLQRFFAGVPTEVFANSAAWLRTSIRHEADGGRPVMAHMLATGLVLRDDGGAMASLVAEAKEVLRAGPVFADEVLLRRRYLAACAVKDALDLLPSTDGDAILVTRRCSPCSMRTSRHRRPPSRRRRRGSWARRASSRGTRRRRPTIPRRARCPARRSFLIGDNVQQPQENGPWQSAVSSPRKRGPSVFLHAKLDSRLRGNGTSGSSRRFGMQWLLRFIADQEVV